MVRIIITEDNPLYAAQLKLENIYYIDSLDDLRILHTLSGVALLYAYHAQSGKMLLKRELDVIQNILHSQYTQYKQSRDSIDLINRKYHDLKHQIAVLRSEQDSNRRTAFL